MSNQQDNFPVASFFKRIAALVYDGLLLIAIYFVVGGIAVAINKGEAIPMHWSLINSLLIFPSLGFLFFYWFWNRCGQTLGMQAWHLKLVANTGSITLQLCAKRYLSAIFGFACCGLGFIWMFFDQKKRTWQDIVSASQIYQLPKR